MSELEFKKLQLKCVNKSIEALCGVIDIPAALKFKKVQLERELFEIQSKVYSAREKVFDQQLIKE